MARPRSKEFVRRDEIVDAALRLILKLGYNQVTLADIAAQVGVSKGLISYYFPKKEDVFLAVLEQIVARLTTDFESFCNAEATAPEKMLMIFNNLFGNEKRARRYYTVVIDYMAQAIRMRQVQEYTQSIYNSYRTYMERIVAQGIGAGEFRPVDTEKAVSMILGMMEGLVLQWFFDKKGFDLDSAYTMCADFLNCYLMPEGVQVDTRPPAAAAAPAAASTAVPGSAASIPVPGPASTPLPGSAAG